MICILTEKPSARRNFEKALGGKEGVFHGEPYILVNSVGHILGYPENPAQIVAAEKQKKYQEWSLANLPWEEKDFIWRKQILKGSDGNSLKPVYDTIKKMCQTADEIVIATDNDPSGEGTLLAAEILLTLPLKGKRFSRMFFVDESVNSIQTAFLQRVPVPDLAKDRDYIKADYRSKWDYLSMQFSRIATKCGDGRSVLRNGRLKSFMNSIVGDGLLAVSGYRKIPFYQNAFRDENGVWYTKKGNQTFPRQNEVPIKHLKTGEVIVEKRELKKKAPPKLLDLAGLSAKLSGKGIKAKEVLAVYQKMYENQYVSYPRTEDKEITPEQFEELLPRAEEIAKVVGVNPAILTHKEMRRTHVKTGGSHGANRPGNRVPQTLEELEQYGSCAKEIYSILAVNYLAMLCEDYEYEVQSGYVKAFPDYVGTSSIPRKMGFKTIWREEEKEVDEEDGKGLGRTATPCIKEGFPPKPPTPTMKWLMKQLEKYNVGTGATRTSCYAEITNEKAKYPLMKESKGKLTLTTYGEMNYILLQGTHIGSAEMTEKLQEEMELIAAGKISDINSLLHEVQRFVIEDLRKMQENRINIPKELFDGNEAVSYQKKEKISGIWKGKEISFSKSWSEHVFTEEEIQALLRGETITFQAVSSKTKKPYSVSGKLEKQRYKGKEFIGFKADFGK